MYVLGIESTAHTISFSVVQCEPHRDLTMFKQSLCVLSNERKSFTTATGGMIPARVADHHVEHIDAVLFKALDQAGITMDAVDVIAVAHAPGIGHTLRIGIFAARLLARLHKKPIIGVNHCIAHLEVGRLLTDATDPILLYASGANTQVIAYEASKYRVFGETLDIGIGNFLDALGRELGLGFPSGPRIEELARESTHLIALSYLVKGMDVSFGGLLTWLKKNHHAYAVEDVCFSVQETVFAMLMEVAERAMAHTGKRELVLGGGVACNNRLQEMAGLMCAGRGARAFFLENQYYVDNAAMIALTGALQYVHGKGVLDADSLSMRPYERTDDVIVYWR